ncbi:hypothetical protein [Tsukamurella hominis]|uniref:hypothetical protein n=1 Tax=Tsukamurella hominis TaxID=1970232 RepID=UPI0039E90083
MNTLALWIEAALAAATPMIVVGWAGWSTRTELLVLRSETFATATVGAFVVGALSILVGAAATPAVPLHWFVGYHVLFIVAAALAWAICEIRIRRAFPPRPLYQVTFDATGTAVATEVRGTAIDAVLSRTLVPLLAVAAAATFVLCYAIGT